MRPARRGSQLLEGAIVLGIVVVLVLSGLDLALALTRYQSLCDASRRAVRAATVRGSKALQLGPLGPSPLEFAADHASPVAAACRTVLIAMEPAEVTIRVEWPDGGNQFDQRVRASLAYEHQPIVPIWSATGGIRLTATSTLPIAH
jgi:hypothetical protein